MKEVMQDPWFRGIVSGACTVALAVIAWKIPAVAAACTLAAGMLVPAAYKTTTKTE